MKKLLFIFMMFPIWVVAQTYESPYLNLKLQDGQVKFEQVYLCDSMNVEQVAQMLTAYAPTIKDLRDFRREGDVMTGQLKGAYVNYKKYGGKWGNTPVVLNAPFDANLTFLWKEGRYKAIASNIVFHTGSLGDAKMDDQLTTNRGSEWSNRKAVITVGKYLEQYLADLLEAKPKDNW